jgi:hypothetical protein
MLRGVRDEASAVGIETGASLLHRDRADFIGSAPAMAAAAIDAMAWYQRLLA